MDEANKKVLKELLNSIKDRKICVLDEVSPCDHCGECFLCDIDPDKICDNCGKCIDQIKTDDKGYAQIKIDKIDASGAELDEFYRAAGVDDVDDDDNN